MFSKVIISNAISLVLRNSDTDSENLNLIRRSVSGSQKTCVSQGVYWPFSHCFCGVCRSRDALLLDNRRDLTQMGQTDQSLTILCNQ